MNTRFNSVASVSGEGREGERFLNSLSSNRSFVLFLICFCSPLLVYKAYLYHKNDLILHFILLEVYKLTVLQYLNPLKSTVLPYSSVSSTLTNIILCADSFNCKHLLGTYLVVEGLPRWLCYNPLTSKFSLSNRGEKELKRVTLHTEHMW